MSPFRRQCATAPFRHEMNSPCTATIKKKRINLLGACCWTLLLPLFVSVYSAEKRPRKKWSTGYFSPDKAIVKFRRFPGATYCRKLLVREGWMARWPQRATSRQPPAYFSRTDSIFRAFCLWGFKGQGRKMEKFLRSRDKTKYSSHRYYTIWILAYEFKTPLVHYCTRNSWSERGLDGNWPVVFGLLFHYWRAFRPHAITNNPDACANIFETNSGAVCRTGWRCEACAGWRCEFWRGIAV